MPSNWDRKMDNSVLKMKTDFETRTVTNYIKCDNSWILIPDMKEDKINQYTFK